MKTFFNTIKLSGAKLIEAQKKAKLQDERIYLIFVQNKKVGMTPAEVWNIYIKLYNRNKPPITSIRRSITNLTNEGNLVNTTLKREGMYGADNFIWKLKY